MKEARERRRKGGGEKKWWRGTFCYWIFMGGMVHLVW